MLGFLGPNGAGKTTTMRAVFGLVELDADDVRWPARQSGGRSGSRFGYMPEERGALPRMPVGEQLEYFGRLHGMDAADARVATAHWLGRLGLEGRAGAKLEELSHGNQQRAQLAAALVHEAVSCSSSTSRSPTSTRSPCTRSPGCSATRPPAVRPCSSPAISWSSWRTSVRRSRSSTGAGSSRRETWARYGARQRRRIELQLDGAPPGWLPDVAGVEPSSGATAAFGSWRAARRIGAGARGRRADGAGGRVQLRPAVLAEALPRAGGTVKARQTIALVALRHPRAPPRQGVPRLDLIVLLALVGGSAALVQVFSRRRPIGSR